ncbi:hypothetical protein [Erythrobacter dokdonensis]|uniref:Uncharacterized protein n=1 Tax=Erythrobacter dokdonensis DSW-74 TaxID=1300349 RepID=A0A1A7BLJ1_9SPHN|nr:hypothetical protein [Erythrobacter dokdonensis]OBV12035.1 hypothetical protein I603_0166 [Erythrobacter dokdonensis DSW-74]
MTRASFRAYLAVLAGFILFSLSPLAALGGLVVAVAIIAPLGIGLGSLGLLEKGSGFDAQLAVLFWAFSGCMALTALWFAWRAAGHHEREEPDRARRASALAATAVAAPVVIYFCYGALGF